MPRSLPIVTELTSRERSVKLAAENEGRRFADAAIAAGDWDDEDGAIAGRMVETARRLADGAYFRTGTWLAAAIVAFMAAFLVPDLGWLVALTAVALGVVWIVLTVRRAKAVPALYEKAYYWGMASVREHFAARLEQLQTERRVERETEQARLRALREAHLAERRRAAEAAGVAVGDLRGPEPQPFGVSPQGAERLVAQWMRSLGDVTADVTQYTSDGGIDVASQDYIAQVKHYTGMVGVGEVRELAGVASTDHRTALFFTSTGYAAGAIEFADRAGVALFVYSAEEGTLRPVNELAAQFYASGL